MTGLYVDQNTFMSFSELENRNESGLTRELYASGGVTGFDPVSWLGLLPDPDPVLRKTGDGVAILRGLLGDDKVISSIQNRKLGTLKKKDYLYKAGTAEGKNADQASLALCADLASDLKRVDLYNVLSQVLDAPYYGATPVEIIWEAAGGKLRIADLKPRPVEWFGYNARHEPVFAGEGQLEADPLTPNKVIIARHFPDATNPYGLRLLSRCLWPVAIKKGGIQFWTILCEKFGMPWVIGKVNGDETKRSEALTQLSGMVQDAVAVVSSGTEVNIHSIKGSGGELHPKLIQYFDRCIARALQGQNLTNEGGSTGSYAESSTAADALDDYREADEHLVETFMNNLGVVYQRVNSNEALPPVFRYREPEDYLTQIKINKGLFSTGCRFTPVHYEHKFGMSPEEFYVVDDRKTKDEAGKKTELSDPGGDESPSQEAVDRLCGDLLKNADKGTDPNEKLILGAIMLSESYEEAMERILELYPDLSMDALNTRLEQGLLSASLYGIHTAAREEND